MALDQNEKKLVEKLSTVLKLLNGSKEDLQVISTAKKIDEEFLKKVGNIFDKTEACNVCSNIVHTWRNTVDDETVISFIDDWINWKKQGTNLDSKVEKTK